MVYCLFITSIGQIGFTNMMMSRNQSKLWLSMSVNQNLCKQTFTLLSASSLIRNLTVSYSFCPPTRFKSATSFDSRSALIVSKLIKANPLVFPIWWPHPWWVLRVTHQVPLLHVERLSENKDTLLRLDINIILIFIF